MNNIKNRCKAFFKKIIIKCKPKARVGAYENFDYNIFQKTEAPYRFWTNIRWLKDGMHSLPENPAWNATICAMSLIAIVILSMDLQSGTLIGFSLPILADTVYNVFYGIHITGHMVNDCYLFHHVGYRFGFGHWLWYVADIASYLHFFTLLRPDPVYISRSNLFTHKYVVKIICYYIRLHRPFQYLWDLNDYHLKGSVIGTLIKHWYIFLVIRVIYANVFVWLNIIKEAYYNNPEDWLRSELTVKFVRAFYIQDCLFLPIGTDFVSKDDIDRLSCLLVMISGALLVTGTTVASLSLIIALYMRSEELFRSRFRLIMHKMVTTQVPPALQEKVQTFYTMYWHKQKAVSVTQLMPTYPPTLENTIYTDIFFEATQKSIILMNLSYQFLSEVAKFMEPINYIPGDYIIKRNSTKFAIVYISYGDVEMLASDDDDTPMLRFTRGSILNPCGGCPEMACSRAHVSIRAATFCTAHVLKAIDFWRVASKYGRMNDQTYAFRGVFIEHLGKVKKHYAARPKEVGTSKSTILQFKRNIVELKRAKDKGHKYLLCRNDVFLQIAGCYIMRNRNDATLTEESDAICLRPTFPCILQPSSSLLLAWMGFVSIITLVVAFTHPYHLVYLKTVSLAFKFYDYMVTFVYVVDVVVVLSTGAKIEEGFPITFAETSSRQMRSIWFVLDVLSTLPFFELVGDGRFVGLNKLCKIPKVFRYLKLLEDIYLNLKDLMRFAAYFLVTILMCWLVAALQQGYWCFKLGYCVVTNFTHEPYWANKPLDDDDEMVAGRLAYSLYWAISVVSFTVHKTAASVVAWLVQVYMMVVLEAATVCIIMLQATYSAIIMVTHTMSDQYNLRVASVNQIMVLNSVDPVLKERFMNYLELCWYTDKAYSITSTKSSILFDLPQHVFKDLSAMQRNKYILSIPFMKYLQKEELKYVCSQAKLFHTSPNEILMNTGDMSNEIYIIRQGVCEVVNPKTKQVKALISCKKCFGDLECLLRLPNFYTVRAVTHVELFLVGRKTFLQALSTPKFKDAIRFAKRQPEYTHLAHSSRQQFLEYQLPSPPPNREWFPLPRKYEPDTAFLLPFSRLGFFSIFRYIFPRFTIRPDGKYLRRYEWFRAFCAFLTCNIFPMYSVLVLQFPWMFHFCWFLDISAYLDILQRMLVGYFDENGILVYHPASTAVHYIKSALLFDLFSCLPLETLDSVRQNLYYKDNAYQLTASSSLLMLNRLGQLYRVPNALEILNTYIDRRDVVLLIKSIPILLALLSVVTSAMMMESVDMWMVIGGGGRLTLKHAHSSWITHNAEAVRYNIMETPLSFVLTTYYWVVYEITTTGYNLFQPDNLNLINVLIVGMLIGAITTTYFSVRVISIRSNVNQALASYQDNIKDMTIFMKKEKLNPNLQREVLSYYEYTWDKTGGTDYRSVLKFCDQITLRTDAILDVYGHTFHKCPILSHCDLSLLRLLGRAVHSLYFRQDMTVIKRDDVIADMYFVDYGIMEARDPIDDDLTVTKLPKGSVFGHLDKTRTAICPNKFCAFSDLHLLRIDTILFYRIVQDFPSVKVLMKKYRAKGELDNYIIASIYEDKSDTRSYKMRKFSSPRLQQEYSKKPSWSQTYLNAQSKGVQIYLIIVSLMGIYGDTYHAGFQDHSAYLLYALYTLDVCFLVKIVLNFAVPYIPDEEKETKDAAKVARKRYIKGEFLFDALSCIPLEAFAWWQWKWVSNLWNKETALDSYDPTWTAVSFLRLNRMFRVVTIDRALKRYHQKLSINLTVSTIWSVFIWFSLFIHITACIWYYMGEAGDNKKPRSSWRYDNQGKSVCFNQYICSVYFILTTFTENGVGDILPRQQMEVFFVIVLMICSTLMYMGYVGQFSDIIQYHFFRCFQFYSDYLELQEFLRNNRVSQNLVTQTNKYTLHLWREARGLQAPNFLDNAPQCLRLKVMSAAYMRHLKAHPTFKHCEPAFRRQVVGCFQLYHYDDGMYVVREGEITNSMYFIHKGRVVQEASDGALEEKSVFHAGDHFGTYHGLTIDVAFPVSYKTDIKSEVITLQWEDWDYLLKYFTRAKEVIDRDKDKYISDKLAERMGANLPRKEKKGAKKRAKTPEPSPADTGKLRFAAQPTAEHEGKPISESLKSKRMSQIKSRLSRVGITLPKSLTTSSKASTTAPTYLSVSEGSFDFLSDSDSETSVAFERDIVRKKETLFTKIKKKIFKIEDPLDRMKRERALVRAESKFKEGKGVISRSKSAMWDPGAHLVRSKSVHLEKATKFELPKGTGPGTKDDGQLEEDKEDLLSLGKSVTPSNLELLASRLSKSDLFISELAEQDDVALNAGEKQLKPQSQKVDHEEEKDEKEKHEERDEDSSSSSEMSTVDVKPIGPRASRAASRHFLSFK